MSVEAIPEAPLGEGSFEHLEEVPLFAFDTVAQASEPDQTSSPESDHTTTERPQPSPETVALFVNACTDPALRRIAAKIVGHQAADDVVQEVLGTAWEKLGLFTDHGKGIEPWLRTIAFNTSINYYRKRGRERENFRPSTEGLQDYLQRIPDASSVEDAILDADHSTLEAVLGRLRPERSDAIQAVYIDGEKHREYAERTGMPTNTSLSRVSRGTRDLLALAGLTKEDVRQGRGISEFTALIMGDTVVVTE